MRKIMATSLLVTAMALYSGVKPVQAQDSTPKAERAEKPLHAYRLDFSLNELEGDKKVNTRHYSISIDSDVPGERQEVKIGTRVPVATAYGAGPVSGGTSALSNTQFQYLDVGTHIWCSLKEHGDELELQAGSEISNIDAGPRRETNPLPNPVVRQIKIGGSTVVTPGKPIIIGSADDPTSNRQFQLEVTVTKMR